MVKPLQWKTDQEHWKLSLEFRNASNEVFWVNKRGAHSQHGLEGDYEISVRVEPRKGSLQRRKVFGQGDQPTASDYALLRPDDRVVVEEFIDSSEFAMTPGEYSVSVCFWDQSPNIPPAPEGAAVWRGPFIAAPAILTVIK